MNIIKELDFVYIVGGVKFITEEEAIRYAKIQDEKDQEENGQDDEEKDEKR